MGSIIESLTKQRQPGSEATLAPPRRRAAAPLAILAIACLSAASGETAEPAAETAAGLAARLQEKLDRLESLRGRFEQSLESRGLGGTRTEKGAFAILKPFSMRWEYETPERKLAVTDGESTWLYLPEDRELHIGNLTGHREDGAAIALLTGRSRLDRDFVARFLTDDGDGGSEASAMGPPGFSGGLFLELTPKDRGPGRAGREDPRGAITRLLVGVDPKRLQIRRLVVVDALGDRMVFSFHSLEENPRLAADLFRLDPPAGVEVIDAR